jgi:HK97 family phage portal protein
VGKTQIMPASFQKWFEKYIWSFRTGNIHNPDTPITAALLASMSGGGPSASGKNVTQDNALNFSAVWACTRILSGVISSLPFKIYERTPTGRRTAENHPFYRLTKYPNSYTTKPVYFQRAIIHYLNWGYHLAKIKLTSKDNAGLELIHPSRLAKIEVSTRNTLKFTIKDENGVDQIFPQSEIIYVPNLGDTLMGKGVITHAREDIGLEFAASEYGSKWFKSGGQPQGLIHTDEKLDTKQIEDLKQGYIKQKGQDGNLVMTHGFKYTPMSIPPEDAQFLGTRQFNVLTIARWYGVPPEKLAELDRATYGNIEHNAIAFLADTVAPILSKLEYEYTAKILDEERFYFEFDMDGYMRADIRAQAEVDRIYTAGGIRQINEVRKKKNWNPVEFGDDNYMQLNMTTIKNISEGANLKQKTNGFVEE